MNHRTLATNSSTFVFLNDLFPGCKSQAGSLCKTLGNENLAFVLLNRYVDLTEAIDEGNASLLDNSDFAEATNVPLVDDSNLPTKQVRACREQPLAAL